MIQTKESHTQERRKEKTHSIFSNSIYLHLFLNLILVFPSTIATQEQNGTYEILTDER